FEALRTGTKGDFAGTPLHRTFRPPGHELILCGHVLCKNCVLSAFSVLILGNKTASSTLGVTNIAAFQSAITGDNNGEL
ncbi:MAG: hypothetical protein M3Y84_09470, partial [Acidobacteriota bacterium]|nr:hypothetical protein [Acidobacteriota bacterium]